MQSILAIDPGKTGGAVFCDGIGGFSVHPFRDVATIPRFLEPDVVVMEELYGTASRFPKVQWELARNYGQWEASFPTSEWVYVKPTQWQAGLRLKQKTYDKRKTELFKKAQDLIPIWKTKITRSTADAALILKYYLLETLPLEQL